MTSLFICVFISLLLFKCCIVSQNVHKVVVEEEKRGIGVEGCGGCQE